MTKTCLLTVKGTNHTWSFRVNIDPKDIPEYEADGLEVVQPYYIIPDWVFNARLEKVWMFCTDLFYFRNPFTS